VSNPAKRQDPAWVLDLEAQSAIGYAAPARRGPGMASGETTRPGAPVARPAAAARQCRESSGKAQAFPEGFMITVSPIKTSADLCQTL